MCDNLEAGKVADAQPLFDRRSRPTGRSIPITPILPKLFQGGTQAGGNGRPSPYQRAIAIRRQALGALHPDLALGLADYAELAMDIGASRSADALRLAREAANIARTRRNQNLSGEAAGDSGAEQQALARAQGADASRIDPLARSFGTLLKADWLRTGAAGSEAETLKAEGFEAAQDMETSVAALTMAQTAARTAAGTGPLTELVRQQQDLSAKGRELDRRLLSALASGSQPDAEKLRTEITDRPRFPPPTQLFGSFPIMNSSATGAIGADTEPPSDDVFPC